MMDRYISYIPDAFRYWRYHRRWLEQGKRFLVRSPQQVGKRANRRIHFIIRANVRELPIIIEALVHEAPNEQALTLIGSELLEEAYRIHGVPAFRQFGYARLLPEHRRMILRGVWPSTLRRAWLALKDAPPTEQLPIDTPVSLSPEDVANGADVPDVPSALGVSGVAGASGAAGVSGVAGAMGPAQGVTDTAYDDDAASAPSAEDSPNEPSGKPIVIVPSAPRARPASKSHAERSSVE